MFLFVVATRKLRSSSFLTNFPRFRYYASASAAAAPIQDPPPPPPPPAADPKLPHFMADYLITSCGFTPDKAARISKRLLHLEYPQNPDAVLRFLTHHGFSMPEIQTLITWHPPLLYSSPDKTLAPNLRALRNIGLSPSSLTHLLLSAPSALLLRAAVPRINFWWDFLNRDEADLVKAFKANKRLVDYNITRNIVPKLSLLQNHGLSTRDVRRIVVAIPRIITSNIASLENLLNRTKELGFRPESGGMFVLGLHAVFRATRETLQKKMDLLKSFGWSEYEFLSAVLKAPAIVTLSEDNLRGKVDFLVGEVGYGPSDIVSLPGLLLHSLENRLRPRQHILQLLESKGLLSGKRQGFYSVINLTDEKFAERYVLPYMEEIPEFHKYYLAASAS